MDKPWENEPDYKEGEFCGLKYEIKRNLDMGSFCGYVILPPGNEFNLAEDYDAVQGINVHGKWTYSRHEDDGNFVIGFDCAHAGDLVPMIQMMQDEIMKDLQTEDLIYRDINYVEDQCKRACWQLTGNTFTDGLNEALYQRYANGGE